DWWAVLVVAAPPPPGYSECERRDPHRRGRGLAAMDQSTDGVTLHAGFVFDVLAEYRSMGKVCAPVFEKVQHLSEERPDELVPIKLYNDVCEFIEETFGPASIRSAGEQVGKRVHAGMRANGLLAEDASVADTMRALRKAADVVIHDPKKRGWELLEEGPKLLVMRRTQTFNSSLQFGLLRSLAEAAGARGLTVELVRSVKKGDEFDEYRLKWL
ncbi:MAG: hypothetical protein AAFY60_00895, partial [Myxococcota bacterium]